MLRAMQSKFPYLAEPYSALFSKEQFELFYPSRFRERTSLALALVDKQKRRRAKAELLEEVLSWSSENVAEAQIAWAESAREQIDLLHEIQGHLD